MNIEMKNLVLQKYEIIELVGKGSYGCVSKATQKKTGKTVALKVIQTEVQTEYELIKLIREIKIQRSLNRINRELQLEDEDKC